MVDTPDFVAGHRIVGDDPLGAGNDELIYSCVRDQKWSRVGFAMLSVFVPKWRPWCLPDSFTRVFIKSDDELSVDAIADKDDQILIKQRRTADSHAVENSVGVGSSRDANLDQGRRSRKLRSAHRDGCLR